MVSSTSQTDANVLGIIASALVVQNFTSEASFFTLMTQYGNLAAHVICSEGLFFGDKKIDLRRLTRVELTPPLRSPPLHSPKLLSPIGVKARDGESFRYV
jgi:hypothetical protein